MMETGIFWATVKCPKCARNQTVQTTFFYNKCKMCRNVSSSFIHPIFDPLVSLKLKFFFERILKIRHPTFDPLFIWLEFKCGPQLLFIEKRLTEKWIKMGYQKQASV